MDQLPTCDCVLMLNIEPHILPISVCFSLESSMSYMNMDILQNRTGTVRILTLFVYLFIYPNRQRRNPFADEVIAKITVA